MLSRVLSRPLFRFCSSLTTVNRNSAIEQILEREGIQASESEIRQIVEATNQ